MWGNCLISTHQMKILTIITLLTIALTGCRCTPTRSSVLHHNEMDVSQPMMDRFANLG
jgi:hypothetical protein